MRGTFQLLWALSNTSNLTCVLSTQKGRLVETGFLSTNNKCFWHDMGKRF